MKKLVLVSMLVMLMIVQFAFANNFVQKDVNGEMRLKLRDNNAQKVQTLLWDNTDIAVGTSGIVSSDLRGYPEGETLVQTADDFVVGVGYTWSIDSIYTEGFSNAATLPDSFGVNIFADNGGLPGDIIYATAVVPANGIDFTSQAIALPDTVVLEAGTYWLSIYGVYNTGNDLNTTRWDWYTGATAINNEAALRNFTSNFGGALPWTPLSVLGVAGAPSCFFAIFGDYETNIDIHDYTVNSVTPPGLLIAEEAYEVTANIENIGEFAETDVPVKLFENDTEITSLTLSLEAGQDSTVTFAYTPAASGDYTLSVIAELTGDVETGNDTASVEISILPAGLEVVFFDDFENGEFTDLNWNITVEEGTGAWARFTEPYPNTYEMPETSSGYVLAADSDENSTSSMTTATLAFDFTDYSSVVLDFDSDWNAYQAADQAIVKVSIDSGATWTPVLEYGETDVRATHVNIDLSAELAGHDSVLIAFQSIQPGWDWYWVLDNVQIMGVAPVGISDMNNIHEFSLEQNYPNPFNPTTQISYNLPKAMDVNITIYNAIGQKVRTLVNGHVNAGPQNIMWDARDDHGNVVSTGLYIYKINAGNNVQAKKMMFLK